MLFESARFVDSASRSLCLMHVWRGAPSEYGVSWAKAAECDRSIGRNPRGCGRMAMGEARVHKGPPALVGAVEAHDRLVGGNKSGIVLCWRLAS